MDIFKEIKDPFGINAVRSLMGEVRVMLVPIGKCGSTELKEHCDTLEYSATNAISWLPNK